MQRGQSGEQRAGWSSYRAMGTPGGQPLDAAYSRVTNPERFTPLHQRALETVTQLRRDYELAIEEGMGLDEELERTPLARPTIRLTPVQGSGAPVTIAFTDLPGLRVRAGSWTTDVFPSCACDMCDEMPEEEFERFTELLSNVVAGRFRESMRLQPDGSGWSTREFWNEDRPSSGGSRVPRNRAARVLDGKAEIVLEWMPWQPKPEALSPIGDSGAV